MRYIIRKPILERINYDHDINKLINMSKNKSIQLKFLLISFLFFLFSLT